MSEPKTTPQQQSSADGVRYTLEQLNAMPVGTKLNGGDTKFTKIAGPKAKCRHWIARCDSAGTIGECTTAYVEQFQFWPEAAHDS